MAGVWSGRLNFKNFPESDFVPELLGCSGVFILLSLSSFFSLFLSLMFSRGKGTSITKCQCRRDKAFSKGPLGDEIRFPALVGAHVLLK